MADFRPLLSPITIGNTLTTAEPFGETRGGIFLNSGGSSTLIFSLNRLGFANENKSSYFEYAEILRNYLDITFDGTYISQTLDITLTFEQLDEPQGTTVFSTSESFIGIYGYTDYRQGDNVEYTTDQPAISTTNLYIPDGVAGYIPSLNTTTGEIDYNTFSTTDTTKTIGSTVFTIKRICEPKYQDYKVTFVNKFGALQDLYFYLIRRDTTTASSDTYKAHKTTPTGGYVIEEHSKETFNIKANDKFILNTCYLDETYNDVITELMLSDKIWITENAQVLPIRITTTSLEKKTTVNDKLIQYTLEFEYAFDKINNIL